jgi:hypothetical protein
VTLRAMGSHDERRIAIDDVVSAVAP